jgi:hypothetical protein
MLLLFLQWYVVIRISKIALFCMIKRKFLVFKVSITAYHSQGKKKKLTDTWIVVVLLVLLERWRRKLFCMPERVERTYTITVTSTI